MKQDIVKNSCYSFNFGWKLVKNEIVGGLWLFISIFVRGDNKNLQIDMKNLPLIEVTELIKGIESSDNFQDDLSIADLNGDLINYEEKRLEHSTPMRLNALLMILVQEGTADISVDYHTGIESEQRFERAFVDRVQIFSGWIYYPGREKELYGALYADP